MTNKTIYILMIFLIIKISSSLITSAVISNLINIPDHQIYANQLYSGQEYLRTLLIFWLSKFFLFITFESKPVTHIMFSLLSGLGILYFSVKLKSIKPLILLLLPSSFIFTSIAGKEAICYLITSLLIIDWVKFIDKTHCKKIIIRVILYLCIFGMLRPHYAYCFILLFLLSYSIEQNYINKKLVYGIIITISSILIYYSYHKFLVPHAFGGINKNFNFDRFITFGINNHEDLRRVFDISFFLGIIGPYPQEALNKIKLIPFLIEGLFILLFPIVFYVINRKKLCSLINIKKNKHFIYVLIPTIVMLMSIHSAFGILNMGSSIRWRVNFELLFYFAPLVLYLKKFENA